MILADVRDYLALRGRAPVSDIAARFEVDVSAVHAMLDHLIRKGRARLIETPTGKCGGCCGCAENLPEVYEWLNTAPPR